MNSEPKEESFASSDGLGMLGTALPETSNLDLASATLRSSLKDASSSFLSMTAFFVLE